MPTPEPHAAIRPHHVLKVIRWLALGIGGMAAWMFGAVFPSEYLGAPWVVGYVLASALTFLVWFCASIEAQKEADRG